MKIATVVVLVFMLLSSARSAEDNKGIVLKKETLKVDKDGKEDITGRFHMDRVTAWNTNKEYSAEVNVEITYFDKLNN